MSWNGYLFKSAIIASVITFIIGMFTTGINSLNASIAGYSLLIITILGILIQLIRTPISNKEGNSTLKLLWIIIRQTGPFLLILAIIGFMYLIAVFAMISTSIVYIILTFYRTDGFQGLQKNDSEKIQFNYLL